MGLLDSFRDLPPPLRILAVVFTIVSLWLGIHCVVIIADGNRNPSLPMSTPCPMLNASMMPSQYQLEGSQGWHDRTRLKSALAPDGSPIPLPSGLDVVVENRCFNGGIGSVFLWVNNELAAFSRIDREIYDCHGVKIYDTDYLATINSVPKLKVYSPTGKYMWESDIPDYGSDLLITDPTSGTVVASINSANKVTVANAASDAADPRLIIIMNAVSYFTEKYSTRRTTRSKRRSSSQSQRLDGCNGFVMVGGIMDIIFFGMMILPCIIALWRKYQAGSRVTSGQIKTHTGNAVQLNELRIDNVEAAPHASSDHTAISKPAHASAAVVPNAEGFMLSGAAHPEVNGVYRVHAYTTRNGAPTFTQPEQPSVEIFLDYGGGSPSWVIQSNGSTVYAMLPNSMDPSYNYFPNIAGSWVVARPGDYGSVPVMAPIYQAAAPAGNVYNTQSLVDGSATAGI